MKNKLTSIALASLAISKFAIAGNEVAAFLPYINGDSVYVYDQCLNLYVAHPYDCSLGDVSGVNLIDAPAPPFETNISSVAHGSIIDIHTMNHIHQAIDYVASALDASGCSACTGGATGGLVNDPRVAIVRIHSSRESFKPSSLGIGVFLSYDISLNLFESNGLTYVDCNNPNWTASRRLSPSGDAFVDNVYKSIKSLILYDAQNGVTTSRSVATRAVLHGKGGHSMEFDLFINDSATTTGRLARIIAPDGRTQVSLSYLKSVNDPVAPPDEKLGLESVRDSFGNALNFSHARTSGGRLVVTTITLPGARSVNYSYDSLGNLTSVTLPGGDTSTFSRSIENGKFKVSFEDTSATRSAAKKTVWYSNNIAQRLLDDTSRPAMYNQSSMLVLASRNGAGELGFFGVGGISGEYVMRRKVYTGGGRMRFTDVAKDIKFKSWTTPATLSASNPFSSIQGVWERHGHSAPFQNYAQNRSGVSPVVTVNNGNDFGFKYDANGNMTSGLVGEKRRLRASNAKFNKPILNIDYSGNAVVSSYDNDGNLISQKKGWVLDRSLGAGAEVSGVSMATYPTVTGFGGFASATPDMVMGVDSIAGSGVANSAVRYSGKLILPVAGPRTFHMKVNKGQSRLHINGGYYTRSASQGETAITLNLSAGAHDIMWETVGGVEDFYLAWSGPETLVAGVPVKSGISSEFLRHLTTADEFVVRAGPSASEQTWEYYTSGNLQGLLKASVDGAGQRSEYSYDANRRLVEVKQTGDSGSLVTIKQIVYDSLGRVAAESDAMGRSVTYGYDVRDRKIKTSYTDGTAETVKYGTGIYANLVMETKDRAGAVTKTDYDAAGRAIQVRRGYALADNDGNITTTLSNPSIETRAYLDGTTDVITRMMDGKITDYDYDYKGRLVGSTQYPSDGKKLVTKTVYSPDELRLCEVDAHGCRKFYAYRGSDKHLVREIHELVPSSLTSVNAAFGNLEEIATNINDLLLGVTRDLTPNPGYAVTDYTLDNEGRTILSTDPRGMVRQNIYDAKGRVISTTVGYGTPLAQTTTRTYDAADRVLAQTDAISRTTSREYLPSGRLKKVTFPDAKTQEFTYYADGRTASRKNEDGFVSTMTWSVCCGREFGSANPKGEGTLKFYDGLGRVTYEVTVNDVAGASSFVNWTSGISLPASTVVSARTMKYDARGRLIASTIWNTVPSSVDPHHPPIAPVSSTDGFTTTYEHFDDLGDTRLAPAVAQLASQGILLTSGSAVLITNPTGDKSFNIVDGAGRSVASGQLN